MQKGSDVTDVAGHRPKVEMLRPDLRSIAAAAIAEKKAEAARVAAAPAPPPPPAAAPLAPPVTEPPAARAAQPRSGFGTFELRKSSYSLRRLRALLFILIPTAAAALYCYMFAAPMYASSVKFSIRGQSESPANSIIGKLLPGSGSAGAAAFLDGFSVRDYLTSGDALAQLQKKVDYVSRMKKPKGDFFYHLTGNEPQESILDFYRRMVNVRFNMAEGIISLDVYAFTPEDAFLIATDLTKLAGEFSNEINQRMTEETLRTATEEYKRAEKRFADARVALTNWRKANGHLDVEANAKMYQQIVTQLESQLSLVKNELEELKLAGLTKSPRLKPIEDRIKSLNGQIDTQNARMTSATSGSSVVNLLADYQRLNLEQEFAAKNYELVSQSLQSAQSVTRVRQKHVAIVVSPNRPEKSSFPDPWKIVPLTFMAAIFVYLIGVLTASVIRDNRRAS